MDFLTLSNGVQMPLLGYGVYQITDPAQCQKCVEDALGLGYRLIDTAQAYGNESAVGAAIRASGVRREELFITTKLWISDVSESSAQRAFEQSLQNLGLDFLDLYLIHQPYNDVYGAWRAMKRLYEAGAIRALGVSNFYPDRLVDFCLYNELAPQLNQVECHPLHAQFEAQEVMRKYNVAMQSWASFGEGRSGMFENPLLLEIGKAHNKSVAQVILRWLYQRGIITIPKTTSKARMAENLAIFDFALSEDSMRAIAGLDSKQTLFINHRDVERIEWLKGYKG